MIETLFIKNVILIEEAKISFSSNFNVLSGETGSGKTAVMQALQLALGGRSDSDLIRYGQDKAIVEAHFNIEKLPQIQRFLQEKGIEVDDPSFVLLKRELSSTGKSRAYINHQLVQLSLLKMVGEQLVEIVSQHANHQLFHLDSHRKFLDLYSENDLELKAFQLDWQKLQKIDKEIASLKFQQPTALRDIENCNREIEEIEKGLDDVENEEVIFNEFSTFNSYEERLEHVRALEELFLCNGGILENLKKAKQLGSELVQLDSTIDKECTSLSQILFEVDDFLHFLYRYQSPLTIEPHLINSLNQKLKTIHHLKKRYGSTSEQVIEYLKQRKKQLRILENIEEELQCLENESEILRKQVIQSSQNLSQCRKQKALLLSKKITLELHRLNMPQAEFVVHIDQIPLSLMGQDKIEFFLSTNQGERLIPLKEGVSGGELARVLLAFHLIFSGKEKIGTLIFDEIDANIGGTTATAIGRILKELGESLQIFSITHFPQVAKLADCHLQISKFSIDDRTYSQIIPLAQTGREVELIRMNGG